MKRNSSFELMRILSMLMIVIWHFLIHGNIWYNTTGFLKISLDILVAFLLVHVNSFVLLTGYFQCEKKLNLKKVINLNCTAWFYANIILICLLLCTNIQVTNFELIKTGIPLCFYDTYWFITCYLLLYLVSPLLNLIIDHLNKKQVRHLLGMLLFFFSFLPYCTNGLFYNVGRGYSLIHFIVLYLIGAYLRKYPISKSKWKLLGILGVCLICNCCTYWLGESLMTTNSFTLKNISSMLLEGFLSYNNPFLILQSICYFLFWASLKFTSNRINKIASCTLGIYLLSDFPYLRQWLYPALGYKNQVYDWPVLFSVLKDALLVFIICLTIEYLRKTLMKKISATKRIQAIQAKLETIARSKKKEEEK